MTQPEVRHVVAWQWPVRWAMCATLWSVFALSWLWPGLGLPLRAIAPLGFAAALLRTGVLLLERDHRRAPSWLIGLALGADAALLTGLLDITGGPFNPFLVMYVAVIWLAAISVPVVWGVVVATVAVGGFGWLVIDHLQAGLAEHHSLNDFPTHLFTMSFVGATVADLSGHYVGRARGVLAQRQAELEQARERAVRSERLASLTTLAAGAAHELSTPLSTIAVAAKELERSAQQANDRSLSAGLVDDARLIQAAVQRCRSILDGMSGRATGGVPAMQPMSPAAVAEQASATLSPERRQRLDVEIASRPACAIADGAEIARALSSLLKNAFDASGDQRVSLSVGGDAEMLRFEVRDRGQGMSADTRRRAGEPFFTTKPPGEGLGLGLFLARTVAEQSGGSLRFEGTAGTVAILEIPAAVGSVKGA